MTAAAQGIPSAATETNEQFHLRLAESTAPLLVALLQSTRDGRHPSRLLAHMTPEEAVEYALGEDPNRFPAIYAQHLLTARAALRLLAEDPREMEMAERNAFCRLSDDTELRPSRNWLMQTFPCWWLATCDRQEIIDEIEQALDLAADMDAMRGGCYPC